MKKYMLTLLAGTVVLSMSAFANPVVEMQNVATQEKVQVETQFQKKIHKVREDFADKLKLTEEQKKKADEIYQNSRAEMDEIYAQIKELRKKADALREKNKTEFESLLTQDQKDTLKSMADKHKGGKNRRKWMKKPQPIEMEK